MSSLLGNLSGTLGVFCWTTSEQTTRTLGPTLLVIFPLCVYSLRETTFKLLPRQCRDSILCQDRLNKFSNVVLIIFFVQGCDVCECIQCPKTTVLVQTQWLKFPPKCLSPQRSQQWDQIYDGATWAICFTLLTAAHTDTNINLYAN